MLNLDKHPIEVACPQCGFYNSVTLKQIRLRDAVICRGCKVTINFEDHMNETRELEEQLKSIGTIKIRL